MSSILATFHIDWKIILAQAVNFGIVFFVLYRYAIKPLSKVISERQSKIEGGLKDAAQNASLLQEAKGEYEKIKQTAHKDAQTILAQAKEQALKEQSLIMAEGVAAREALIAKTKQELKREKEKVLKEAKQEIGALIALAAEKVLEDVSDKKVDQKIIDSALLAVTSSTTHEKR